MDHVTDIEVGNIPELQRLNINGKWVTDQDVKTWKAVCDCGWEAPKRTLQHEAEDDEREHLSRGEGLQ